MSTTTTEGFSLIRDDNNKCAEVFTPKTGQRLTGIETTTVSSGTFDSGLVRVVATVAINFAVSTSSTDAVTTSAAYLPANTIEYVKVNRELDRIRFLGSSVVYMTSMK